MSSSSDASPSSPPPPPDSSSSSSPPPPPSDSLSSDAPPSSSSSSSSPPPPDSSSSPPPTDSSLSPPPPPPPDSSSSSYTPPTPTPPADKQTPPSGDSGSITPSTIAAPASPALFSPSNPSTVTNRPLVPSTVPHASSSSSSPSVVIAASVLGGVAILALFLCCIICIKRRRKKHHRHGDGRSPHKGHSPVKQNHNQYADHVINMNPALHTASSQPAARSSSSNSSGPQQFLRNPPYGGTHCPFTYEELATATNGFSQENVLGQGGFGFVYKGILSNGKEVAVKSLKAGSGQGDREFQAEVEIISRVHHRHLVSLVGYCIAEDKRLLVYEFVPNKTLEIHLHGKGEPVMDWASRLRIALGSAKGLAYLHEDCHPRIIHRDIKAANILLDQNFEAMVADFGLAKLTADNFTHVSTRVMGTFGYLAPEYAASGKLTEKSDVFSFGVMLLELITGHRPIDTTNTTMDDSLVDWARPLLSKALEEGDYSELVDPRLRDNYVPQEMVRMVACASACICHSARRRPKMSQIVRTLDGVSSLEFLNEVVKSNRSQANREIYDTQAYNADMLKLKKMVTQEEDVEYGNSSSEFSETGKSWSSKSDESTAAIDQHNLHNK